MKYWKGKPGTVKEGQMGVMDDNGYVPDSIEITGLEYDEYIRSLPKPESKPESDIDKLVQYAKKQKWI